MSSLMKDNVIPLNTFPPIINWNFNFLLVARMAAKKLMNVHETLEY